MPNPSRPALLLAFTILTAVAPAAAWGQSPAAKPPPPGPSPAAAALTPPPAAPDRTVTLTPSRPGTYSYWVVSAGSGQGSVGTLNPGDPSARVGLAKNAVAIEVLDETTGLSAIKKVGEAKNNATVTVAPGDFNLAHTVVVKVTANGKPVEKASVEIKDAKGTAMGRVLTSGDNGEAKFNNIALGKATVTATYGANNAEKATQETSIAPGKGGGPVEVTLTLSGNVPTLDTPATAASAGGTGAPGSNGASSPTIIVQPSAPAPAPAAPRNDWVSGIVGIMLLVGGAVFGMRYLKTRGMTVAEAVKGGLKGMGAELPEDGAGAGGGVGHLKPAAPSLPPLPSLHELPAGGAAAVAAVPAAGAYRSPAPGSGPRLVGLAGPVSGEVFNLEASGGLTVGRDAANSLPMPQDTTVSRRHARFAAAPGGGWEVTDEGSSNGTYVNGRKAERQPLQPGDEVQIGSARFRFEN